MDFDGVPAGKIVPVYLTDEGDFYPICFQSEEELDLLQRLISGLLGGKVYVDTKIQLNDPMYKFSVKDIKTGKDIKN